MDRIDSMALRVDFEGRSKKTDGYKIQKWISAEFSGQIRGFEMEMFIILYKVRT